MLTHFEIWNFWNFYMLMILFAFTWDLPQRITQTRRQLRKKELPNHGKTTSRYKHNAELVKFVNSAKLRWQRPIEFKVIPAYSEVTQTWLHFIRTFVFSLTNSFNSNLGFQLLSQTSFIIELTSQNIQACLGHNFTHNLAEPAGEISAQSCWQFFKSWELSNFGHHWKDQVFKHHHTWHTSRKLPT